MAADDKTNPGTPGAPIIEIVDLHKSFGDTEVLKGINLSVPVGSTLVILGGSGSGKTVLMKHMIGLLKPNSGKVIVEGEDIVPFGAEELEQLRKKFGMVFQAAALFDSMTVYENVSFALREHRKALGEKRFEGLKARDDSFFVVAVPALWRRHRREGIGDGVAFGEAPRGEFFVGEMNRANLLVGLADKKQAAHRRAQFLLDRAHCPKLPPRRARRSRLTKPESPLKLPWPASRLTRSALATSAGR